MPPGALWSAGMQEGACSICMNVTNKPRSNTPYTTCAGSSLNSGLPTVQSWQSERLVRAHAQEHAHICESKGERALPIFFRRVGVCRVFHACVSHTAINQTKPNQNAAARYDCHAPSSASVASWRNCCRNSVCGPQTDLTSCSR